jgi:hypothetical protein
MPPSQDDAGVTPETDSGTLTMPGKDSGMTPITGNDSGMTPITGNDAAAAPDSGDEGGIQPPPGDDASDDGPAPDGDDGSTPTPSIWVAAWADAPDSAGGSAGSNQTFREIVMPSVGSRGMVRLLFSTFFGTAPVTLGAVHVGVQTSGAGVTGDVAVTFGGEGGVTIAAGDFVTSDEVSLSFAYGDVFAITEFVSGSWTKLTQHQPNGGNVTSYATASNAGDQTTDADGTKFTQHIPQMYLLDRVDVYGDYAETIATFGSSTTDGVASGLDAHKTYPEQLAAALHAAGRDDVAIANVGIAGTTVLGSGPTAGIHRFGRDVVPLPGVKAVIDYWVRTICAAVA